MLRFPGVCSGWVLHDSMPSEGALAPRCRTTERAVAGPGGYGATPHIVGSHYCLMCHDNYIVPS